MQEELNLYSGRGVAGVAKNSHLPMTSIPWNQIICSEQQAENSSNPQYHASCRGTSILLQDQQPLIFLSESSLRMVGLFRRLKPVIDFTFNPPKGRYRVFIQ